VIVLRPFRLLRRLIAFLLLLAFLYVAVTAGRVWWTARQDDRRVSDVIVVLGASQYDGRPSPVFAARLDHARALYDAGTAPHVVTVGGSQPGDRFTEAEAGRRYLVDEGVPADDVVAVSSGSDTLGSLEAAADVLAERGWDTAVLVTDPPHSLRARTMARDVGIDAVSSPARSGPAVRTRSTQLRYIARETAAYVFYQLFGSSAGGGPDAL
jgi:uncharacterized SAM-binding protein YcdF (DUF218 family)